MEYQIALTIIYAEIRKLRATLGREPTAHEIMTVLERIYTWSETYETEVGSERDSIKGYARG